MLSKTIQEVNIKIMLELPHSVGLNNADKDNNISYNRIYNNNNKILDWEIISNSEVIKICCDKSNRDIEIGDSNNNSNGYNVSIKVTISDREEIYCFTWRR